MRDTVRAYGLLMQKGQAGRPYNVCRGEAFRVGDLLDALVCQSQAAIEVRTDPARLNPNEIYRSCSVIRAASSAIPAGSPAS